MNEILMEEMVVDDSLMYATDISGGGMETIFAALMGFIAIFAIIGLIMYIVSALTYTKLATKADLENKWMAWIPGYGPHYIVLRLTGFNPLLFFVPIGISIFGSFLPEIVSLILAAGLFIWYIFLEMKLFEAFGKNKMLGLLHLIPGIGSLIAVIMIMVIAFGQTEYVGQAGGSSEYEY